MRCGTVNHAREGAARSQLPSAPQVHCGVGIEQNPSMHSIPVEAPQQSAAVMHLLPTAEQPDVGMRHVNPPSTSSQYPLQHWSPVRHDEPFAWQGSTTQ
jgi:hypothetical protein